MSFFVSLLAIEVIGAFFILLIIRRARYNYSILELLSLSFFLGVGFVSCQLFLYHLLGITFDLANLIIIPIVLAILVFSRYVSKPERMNEFLPVKTDHTRASGMERFLVSVMLLQFIWIILLVIPIPVNSHDAVANYALKAKIFYFAGGVPEGFFSWSETTVAHPDYPPLIPFLMTWIYAFTGFNDSIVNMVMPVAYMMFLGLFYSEIRKIFNRPYSILMVFFLATIPQLGNYATIIHADLILAAFVACAFMYFVFYIRIRDKTYLIFSSMLFGFSLWIKNEALVFVGAFIASYIVFIARSKIIKGENECHSRESGLVRRSFSEGGNLLIHTIIPFVIITALAAPWFVTKISAAGNSDINFSKLTLERLQENARHIPVMLNLLQREIFGPKKWNIFWILIFAGMIWKRKKLWKNECFYITLFLTLSVIGYFTGYMAITTGNLYFYINTTISRFMIHFAPIALLLMAFLVKDEVCTNERI